MSEGKDYPRTLSTAIPAIQIPTPSSEPATESETSAKARVAALEREAKAMGAVPDAAVLFHEIGLLWEHSLKHARNAAVAYQSAFKLNPRFVANIRAARRLFADVGNWVMVVQLIDAELTCTESPSRKASLLVEKALILEQRLSRDADANTALQLAISLEPSDLTLLIQLEQLFAEKGDAASQVKACSQLADAVEDQVLKSHYLTTAGLLLEDRIKDTDAATALFRRAFQLDRKDPQLLAAMKRVSQREGTIDEELGALASEAETEGAAAAPTFLQISKTYERLNRPEDALSALLAARRVNADDPLILAELARIYEVRGRFEELAEVLTAWVRHDHDESEFVSINLRLAALYEEQLKRDDDAIARYKEILGKIPGHAGALAGLGKLYFRTKNWAALVETYDAEAVAAEDARQRASKIYKAGETLEERLSKVDEAIARYLECLQISPGFLPAQKALSRLYETHALWPELIAMYEKDLLQTSDRDQQISTLNKIAALYEDRLTDMIKAIECLKRILELQPEHLPTMRNLARLYERISDWREILVLNDLEAQLASDTNSVVSLAHRNAEILEDQLKDRAGAIGAWERVLKLSPNYLPALRALGRLYGQDQRWDSLINMYRAEGELAASPEMGANLIQKIGELYEHKVKDNAQAISAYREVLTLSPSNFPALRALARIYRAQGNWENLIEILRAEAAIRTDPTERANAMFQAAAIWEDQLHNQKNALEGYQEVLRLAPTHSTAIQQLERLLTAKDDVKELIVLLDRQTQTGANSARIAASLKLARLYMDRLNESSRAATCAENALALDPNSLPALRMLERIRSNDKPRRAEIRQRIASIVREPEVSAAMKLTVTDAFEAGSRPSDETVRLMNEANAAMPGDDTLSTSLERVLLRSQDPNALVTLYERRRGASADPVERQYLDLRIGELAENRLRDIDKAQLSYASALNDQPTLFPALQGLARCQLAQGEFEEAVATYKKISAAAKDPQTSTQALLDAADVANNKLNNEDLAVEIYRQIVAKDSLHPIAGPALEEILARRGGAEDLVKLHQSRGEAKIAQKDFQTGASELYKAARLAIDSLDDSARATRLIDQSLMALPTNPESLELKAELAENAENYADAAAALAVRIQQGGDAQQLARVHVKLGGLFHDHLNDQGKAAAHLQTALGTDPTNVEALERLSAIHINSKNWTGAADTLRQLLKLTNSNSAKATHTMSLAAITDEGFSDLPQAIALYKSALELTPNDGSIIDRLVSLYERTSALPELVTMLDKQAVNAPDVKRALVLKMRIGQVQSGPMNKPGIAMATYRQVLEIEPGHIPAHVALAELYGRDPASTAMAIESHRTLLKLEPTRIDSLHALFRMWESLKQIDKAFCTASILVFLKAANEVESAYAAEGRARLVNDFKGSLGAPDLQTLHHPASRTALLEVLRAIGDQFVKLYPPQFDALGIDKKADRLKSDHAVFKAVSAVTSLFAVEEFEAYQSKKGTVVLETTEPLAVCVSADVVRKFNVREQRFHFGRAALGLVDKAAIVRRLSMAELADVLGNAIRIHKPDFNGLGRRNDDTTKQLRKAFSRKVIKALEEPAEAATQSAHSIESFVQGLMFSQDRAGLLTAADVSAGLGVLLHDDNPAASKAENADSLSAAILQRVDVREAMNFIVSDDFFRLRQRLGISLG